MAKAYFVSKKKNLQFSFLEMAAIVRVVKLMATADGKLDDTETHLMFYQAEYFDISVQEYGQLMHTGDDMEPSETIEIIKSMNYQKKKYVAAYLGTIMIIDEDISDRELLIWKRITEKADLPVMTIKEAGMYMAEL